MKSTVAYKRLRRVIIGVIGGTILGIGLVMIILPGPAFIVIPLGLSILATEYLWAKKALHKMKQQISKAKESLNGKKQDTNRSSPASPSER